MSGIIINGIMQRVCRTNPWIEAQERTLTTPPKPAAHRAFCGRCSDRLFFLSNFASQAPEGLRQLWSKHTQKNTFYFTEK